MEKQNLIAMMMILIPGKPITDMMVLLKLMMSMLIFLHLNSRILGHATNVEVTESTATFIQLTTMKHIRDGRS